MLDAEAKTMAPETARVADRFVLQQIDEKRPEAVHDDFSGGEPMIEPDLIAQSAHRRQAYCLEKGIDYGFSLTTNGTRLFPDVVESFLPLGLDGIRVSLAGPESIHNRGFPVYNPSLRNGYMADFENTFVIDTDGSVIPCPSLQGGEMAYGNVASGVDFLAESALIERKLPDRCMTKCELLPLCGGCCRLQALVQTGDFNAVDCHYEGLRATVEHWMVKRAAETLDGGNG